MVKKAVNHHNYINPFPAQNRKLVFGNRIVSWRNFFCSEAIQQLTAGLRSRSRRFSEGVGVGVGVGLSSRLGVGVGVGIFYPTPTPHVHFLYVFVMLAAQLTRPRAPVECSTVIFLREPCRVSRDTACDS